MKNDIGVLVHFEKNDNILKKFTEAKEIGIGVCQLCMWNEAMLTEEYANEINRAVLETGMRIVALWAGWSGPCEWNFTYGPSTIGLVPPAYRESRANTLIRASGFAKLIGVDKIITHVGFIPENPDDPNFTGVVGALRKVCKVLKANGQSFLFETGQETPVTLLRTIQAIGYDNVGINLDTANLMLYGKANTLDSLEVFGKYVMEVHIKDGFYPTDGNKLGREVAAFSGRANLPAVIKRLGELGFSGAFTIEREISGEEQKRDIIATRDLLIKTMSEQ